MLEWFISFQLLHKTQKKHFAFRCAWKSECGCGVILLLVWSSPPQLTHTLTLNVSCYRAQRSSVVYFPMMLSAMWLPPLRGEGNQPFHFQGRGCVQGLTPYSPPSCLQTVPASLWTQPFVPRASVGWKNNCCTVSQQVPPKGSDNHPPD